MSLRSVFACTLISEKSGNKIKCYHAKGGTAIAAIKPRSFENNGKDSIMGVEDVNDTMRRLIDTNDRKGTEQ